MPFDGRVLWYYTQASNVSRYFHVNALGSLGLATDQTGTPVEEMLYYPFGVRWQNTTGFGFDEEFARFPQRDEDLQMYEATFREFNPGLGRWMTPYSMGGDASNPQSLNRYAYGLNNPTTLTDPLGLDPCESFNPLGCPPDSGCEEWDNGSCSGNPTCDSLSIIVPFGCVNPAPCVVLGFPCGSSGSYPGGPSGAPAPGAPPAGQPPLRGGGGAGYLSGEQVLEMTSVVFRAISRACGGNALCIEILTGSAEGLGSVVGIAGVIGSVIFTQSDAGPAARATNTKPKVVPQAPAEANSATQTGSVIDCWNQYAKDLQECGRKYPPGPERQACFEKAKIKLQFCRGEIPGPIQ